MAPERDDVQRVMLIAAHPDDPEFGCGGTIAKLADEGKEITYVLLTSGDKGSHDPLVRPGQIATRREEEQRNAAKVLGVKEVIFLRYADGIVENTIELRAKLAHLIRQYKPDLLLAIDPWRHYQMHPDHRAAGYAALDAVYAAREWYIFAEQIYGEEDPWRVSQIYLFWTENADHHEDVSSTIDRRIKALACHASQVGEDEEKLQKLDKRIRERTQKAGEEVGLDYAEPLKVIKL